MESINIEELKQILSFKNYLDGFVAIGVVIGVLLMFILGLLFYFISNIDCNIASIEEKIEEKTKK